MVIFLCVEWLSHQSLFKQITLVFQEDWYGICSQIFLDSFWFGRRGGSDESVSPGDSIPVISFFLIYSSFELSEIV